ncbi:hypothetical protein KM043_010460 [Ampulex compressa]|nr:hypothetical protein KM043_010460 [Ampulex compressa]
MGRLASPRRGKARAILASRCGFAAGGRGLARGLGHSRARGLAAFPPTLACGTCLPLAGEGVKEGASRRVGSVGRFGGTTIGEAGKGDRKSAVGVALRLRIAVSSISIERKITARIGAKLSRNYRRRRRERAGSAAVASPPFGGKGGIEKARDAQDVSRGRRLWAGRSAREDERRENGSRLRDSRISAEERGGSRNPPANARTALRSGLGRKKAPRVLPMHSPAANLGPSFSAPSLLLLPLLPLLPLLAPWPLVRARAEDPLCQPSLSIPLERAKVRGFENGSLLHEGLVYPPDLHWIADGSIRGCVCRLRACLRKCCEDREILGEGDRPECVELPEGGSPPDLRLEEDQLGPEIRHVGQLRERFLLLNDKTCPGMSYILEPEDYEDDEFVLQANGTLLSAGAVLPQWAYCLDWQESSRRIAVLVCVLPGTEPSSENEQVVFHIGMAVSVPFLFLTFLIYAIIPELRNLYGKTLMCYVACLVLAYAFLVLANYVYLGPALCHCVGKCRARVPGRLPPPSRSRHSPLRGSWPKGPRLAAFGEHLLAGRPSRGLSPARVFQSNGTPRRAFSTIDSRFPPFRLSALVGPDSGPRAGRLAPTGRQADACIRERRRASRAPTS